MTELPDPQPGVDEVLIDTDYAACNWMDTQKRRGAYPDPDLRYPLVLGNEICGRVAALGPEVSAIDVGDRVAAVVHSGGYAERCIASTKMVIPLSDNIAGATGAAFPIVCMTAYHLLHTAYQLQRGQTVLVHAIGGGVGFAVTQIATELGARVIGTVSVDGKGAKAAEYGAELIINRQAQDFVQETMAFTAGRGVDLVIDSLGGETGFKSLDALCYYGHLINIGEAEGWPTPDLRDKLYERSTSFAGFETIHSLQVPGKWQAGIDFVTARIADGRLKVPVVEEFPLQRCQDMHRKLESRTVSGKLVLRMHQLPQ